MTSVTPGRLMSMTWDEIAPLYRPLLDASLGLANTGSVERWLAEWSDLDAALQEAAVLAMTAAAGDVNDAEKTATHRRFDGEIMPRHREIVVSLAAKLLDSGYTRPDLETTLQRFRIDRDLFRAEDIPLHQQLSALKESYNRICGNMTVEWQGDSIPPSRLNRFLQDPDREIREAAWRETLQPYVDHRDDLAGVFDEMLALRQQIATNAGFANYRDYTFAELHRVDYTPRDCLTFQESTKASFVPATSRILTRHQRALGVDSLRPWDLAGDPEQRPAPAPFPSVDALMDAAARTVRAIDPVFGDQFDGMRRHHLLDLDSRAGKRPGGFCYPLAWQKQATIFMNAAGTPLDLVILLHESGHAFHEIAMAELPFVHQRAIGEEMCEVASMSMELLAWPHLRNSGVYTDDEYVLARREHLNQVLTRFPWIAVVDAFQHWLYTDPAATDRDARDRAFVDIWSEYDPDVDWSGLEELRIARWYKQMHIFLEPFYYIEYGLAQLGSLQVWRNAQGDPAQALADLRAALALGGTRPLPDLYARAGARMIVDAGGMDDLVALIETELNRLDG